MKRLIALIMVAMLMVPAVALASDITGAKWYSVITVSNNNTESVDVFATFPLLTQNLIDANFLSANLTDCAMHDTSGTDTAFMPAVNATYPWCLYANHIGENTFKNYLLYTGGNADMDGKIRYFPGVGGMTSTDNATLELSDNFTIEQAGWIDTDNGTYKNLVYKAGAFTIFVSPTVSENITSQILSITSPTGNAGGTWSDRGDAHDGNVGTSATEDTPAIPAGSWGDYLELTHAAIDVGKIRFNCRYAAADISQIDINVFYGGGWHDVYQGSSAPHNTWVEKDIPAGIQSVTKAQIRLYNASGAPANGTFYEFEFVSIDASVTATGVESGEHTVKVMQGSDATNWWDTDWGARQKLTFDNSASSENLTDFPVLVYLDTTNFDFSDTQNDGEDIRFINQSDNATLDYEIENWDVGGEEAWIWVEVPQIDLNSTTDFIYMYYGNPDAADGQDIEGTWNANYMMVQHLSDNNTASTLDSTSNDNDGIKQAANHPVEADGQIYKAQNFDGTVDYINCSNDATLYSGNITLSAWFKVDDISGTQAIVGKVFATESEYGFRLSGGDLWVNFRSATGHDPDRACAGCINALTWYNVVLTYDNSTGTWKAYINAGTPYSSDFDNPPLTNNGGNLLIGAEGAGPTKNSDGLIDEVRMSNTLRSADWIEACYLTGTDAFIAYGSEEVNGLRIYIDAALKDWTNLVSVPDNSENWTFVENYSMPYMEYHKIWIGGVLRQHIEYEYDDTVFSDLSGNGQDTTPTFRGDSSDPDVSAAMASFLPVEEAQAPPWVLETERDFWDTENITATGTFTTTPSPTAAPGVAVIEAIAAASATPSQLPFNVIAGFVILSVSITGSWFLSKYGSRNLWLKITLVTICMAVCVAVKVFDFWMVVFFLIMAIAVALFSRRRSEG